MQPANRGELNWNYAILVRSRDRRSDCSRRFAAPVTAQLRSLVLFASARLTAPENHGARIALCLNTRCRTESFAFFTVCLGVNQKEDYKST